MHTFIWHVVFNSHRRIIQWPLKFHLYKHCVSCLSSSNEIANCIFVYWFNRFLLELLWSIGKIVLSFLATVFWKSDCHTFHHIHLGFIKKMEVFFLNYHHSTRYYQTISINWSHISHQHDVNAHNNGIFERGCSNTFFWHSLTICATDLSFM